MLLDARICPCEKLHVNNSQSALQQERATKLALWRGLGLVLFPGLALVVGLIVLVMPPLPPISTLTGCYQSLGYPVVHITPSTIAVAQEGIKPIPITVEPGKEGYTIKAESGFSFKTYAGGRVEAYKDHSLGQLITVYITRNRPPALGLISDGGAIKMPKVNCHAG